MEEANTEEQKQAQEAFENATDEQLAAFIFNACDELERRDLTEQMRAVLRERFKVSKGQPVSLAQLVTEIISSHERIEHECCIENCNAMITGIGVILQQTLPNEATRAYHGHRIVKALADTVRINTGVFPIQVMHEQVGQC